MKFLSVFLDFLFKKNLLFTDCLDLDTWSTSATNVELVDFESNVQKNHGRNRFYPYKIEYGCSHGYTPLNPRDTFIYCNTDTGKFEPEPKCLIC